MKTNAECALYILRLLKYRLDDAQAASIKLACGEAGRVASEKLWKESNPDDGIGFGSANPYRQRNEDWHNKEAQRIANDVDVANSMYEFALTKICNEVKES